MGWDAVCLAWAGQLREGGRKAGCGLGAGGESGHEPRRRQGLGGEQRDSVSCREHLGDSCKPHGPLRSDSGEGGSSEQDGIFHKAFQMFALLVCFIYFLF